MYFAAVCSFLGWIDWRATCSLVLSISSACRRSSSNWACAESSSPAYFSSNWSIYCRDTSIEVTRCLTVCLIDSHCAAHKSFRHVDPPKNVYALSVPRLSPKNCVIQNPRFPHGFFFIFRSWPCPSGYPPGQAPPLAWKKMAAMIDCLNSGQRISPV